MPAPDSVDPRSRRLLLMRHGAAEAAGPDDRSRRLEQRGRRDAAAAGRWLAAAGIQPDEAFVSSAARTQETWAELAGQLDGEVRVAFEDGLYAAHPETVLETLRTADEASSVVAFVGHNPTVAMLSGLLDDGAPDPGALRAVSAGFPTAALAVFAYDGAWSELAPGTARLTAVHLP